MKPYIHAKSSAKLFGGLPEDYEDIHQLMDSSKSLESSNIHRVMFHSSWGCFVVEKIFGLKRKNSNNVDFSPRDIAEQHCLEDFGQKFLPSLTDYISLIKDDDSDKERFNNFQKEHKEFFFNNPEINDFMLSPLANTGMLKSLWVTHNSWMIGEILPKVFPKMIGQIKIKDYTDYSPSIMFNRMEFKSWIQNGLGEPPSFAKINKYRKEKRKVITV